MDKIRLSFYIENHLSEKENDALFEEKQKEENLAFSFLESFFERPVESIFRASNWQIWIERVFSYPPYPYRRMMPEKVFSTYQAKELEFGMIQSSLYRDAKSFLDRVRERLLVRKRFELESLDLKNDFTAYRRLQLVGEMEGYFDRITERLEKHDFEVSICSDPYFKDGNLWFRQWYWYAPETRFEPPLSNGTTETPPMPADQTPPPERKAKGQAPAEPTVRQVALFIYYRWEAGEREFFKDGKEKGLEKFALEYGFSRTSIQLKFNKFANHPKEGKLKREAGTVENRTDHEAIVGMLEAFPAAHRLAKDTLKAIEQNT